MFLKFFVSVLLGSAGAFKTTSCQHPITCHDIVPKAKLKMDIEGAENNNFFLRLEQKKWFKKSFLYPALSLEPSTITRHHRTHKRIEKAESALGMPWRTSIEENSDNDMLLYMPFWEWQMLFMKENLTNLRILPCTCHEGTTDFTYQENSDKKARIVNLHLASDEYRKIRMTYYDAGNKTQVFNSLWYPSPEYNLPVLGIDLIQFNRKKHLAVVDFQPIHKLEESHSSPYEHLLETIRKDYPSLQGKMSARFYDETQFFSKQMLFSRFDQKKVVHSELMPAFQRYIQTHLKLVKNTIKNPVDAPNIMKRQQAYDTYSAERDPAAAMFQAMFGKEWSDLFMHEYLFSLSEKNAEQ